MKNNTKVEALSNGQINRFKFTQGVREFFLKNGFLDCQIPPIVPNPGMETHIHPFQLASVKDNVKLDLYLHTSPEFYMKKLLSEGLGDIFTIGYAFRDEPISPIHRPQFLMLEWYRANARYEKIMEDVQKLVSFMIQYMQRENIPLKHGSDKIIFERMTVQELFEKYLGVDILNYLEVDSIKHLIEEKFKDIPLPRKNLEWDDYYFLLFLNKIEPELVNHPYLLIYEYPFHLSALATLKNDDSRVCERFELYMDGVEICNCFNELRDIKEQKARFKLQALEKKKVYGYELPDALVLYDALNKGMPESSGVALGIERLYHVLSGRDDIFWE